MFPPSRHLACAALVGAAVLAACGPEPVPPPTPALVEARAPAAPAGASRPSFRTRVWTTEDGLPAHTVTGFAQTSDGFLWVATTGGLARFDGERFDVRTARDEGLPTPRLNGLAVGPDDALWLVTEAGEVARLHEGGYEIGGAVGVGGEVGGAVPVGLDAAGRPHVLVGDRLETPGSVGASRPVAGPFARGGDGELWVRCDGDRRCRVRAGEAEPVGAAGVAHVVQAPGRAAPVVRDGARWRDVETRRTWPAVGVPRLVDRRGRLWGLEAPALVVSEAGAAAPAGRFALPGGDVTAVVEDREGVVWVATTAGGLMSVHEIPFDVVSAGEGLPPGPVLTLTESRLGVVVATPERDLYRVEAGRAERLDVPPGRWHGAADGTDGTLWLYGEAILGLGPDGGRRTLEGGASEVRPVPGGLWVRRESETALYEIGSEGVRAVRRVPTAFSHSLTVGPDGAAWVATNDGLVQIGAAGVQRITAADGLPVDIARAVHVAADGAIWIGTYGGGLARLAGGQLDVIDESQGLAENVVSSLFEDASGMFWMGGNRSVHRVSRRSVEAVFAGRAERAVGVAYGRPDGLLNPEGSGWPALQARDGRLWFPTFEGAAVVDPGRALGLEARRPRAHVVAVLPDEGAPVRASGPVALAPDERRFAVAFTAAATRAPDRVEYEYRLEGLDAHWVGPVAEREATYTNVPPGRYTFRVRARTEDGAWSDEATVDIRLDPFVWETPWFRALAALALLLGVGLVVRRRFARLRERARELDAVVAARTADLAAEKETVAAQAAELRTLDEAKSRLFANVSHEFRTPLQLILGPLADVAEGRHGPVADDALEQVDLASRNGRRLLALVEQLLAVARLEGDAPSLTPVRLEAATFAARVAEAFRPLAERNGVALATRLEARPATFDPDLCETALANLLANAVSHTPAGGTVTLGLEARGRGVAFSVADTGPGLDPEHAARVFDRFYRAEGGAGPRRAGTGIGLALVREVARAHGGAAAVESVPGEGATFTLTLPEAGGPAGAPGASRPVPDSVGTRAAALLGAEGDGQAPSPAGPPTLAVPTDRPLALVVDDEPDLRAFVGRQLRDRYLVVEAADGLEALERARERVPDVVVSDVMMPGLDGLGLVRALRADPETDYVPVLLLTARAEVADTVEGLGVGADDYLAKPFAPAELRARVDALVAARRRLRERWEGAAAPLPAFAAPTAAPAQRRLVAALVEALDARIDDDGLTVEALAGAVGLSRATLYRRLDGALEGSVGDLVRAVRLERAAALLRDGAGTVTEVAYAVGFKSASHFGACFRERFGATPSAYARAARTGA